MPDLELDLATLQLPADLPVLSCCAFVVPFAVRSKSNYRAARGRGRDWSRLASFEDDISSLARVARPGTWPALDDTVALPDRPQVALAVYASGLVDAANLTKSVADALEGVLYLNDASVRAASSFAHRSGRAQHGAVALAALDPSATLADVVATSAHLASWLAVAVGEPGPS